jgi:hypothetical protein
MEMIWIDALQFQHYGEWRAETQFVREMGQGYLLALKTPGYPAKDCETTFSVAEKKMYRLWVRTKNWLKDHAPGKFYALVDGGRIGNELGTLPSDIWGWQIAGDTALEPGIHTLAMNDSTGYFPRFAAVLITDDMDYTPSPEWERIRKVRARLLGTTETVCAKAFDVVVVGAGPGGIPAAIAAAREGLSVALVHSRPVLGGNSSNEAYVGFDGAYSRNPGMRESGIAEELRRIRDSRLCTWQDALEILCADVENLTIFLNQCVIDAEMEPDGKRLVAAIAQNTLDGSRTAFRGKMFIDASGDGWLGYYAGAAYRVGREAHWQHGEDKAPRDADGRTMSGCLLSTDEKRRQPISHDDAHREALTYSDNFREVMSFYAEDTGEPSPFCAPEWAQVLPKALHREPGRCYSGEWWIENQTDYDDLFEGEMVRDRLMVISLGYFHWLKNHYEKRDLARNLRITAFPAYNAKRESRRLIGDYVLNQEDCATGRPFEDAVAYAGWTIDIHNQEGIFSGASGPYDFDIPVPINYVPFRCLYSKNIDNLLMAGRCISATHIALGTVRVENTLATIGQAAGTGAALALKLAVTPRELAQNHIRLLQQTLLRNDQYIPGVSNEEPDDLARTATVTASSYSRKEVFYPHHGIIAAWQPLDETWCLAFKDTPQAALSLYLRNSGGATTLSARWAEMDSYDRQEVVEAVSAEVPAGFDGYIDIPRSYNFAAKKSGLQLLANAQLSVERVEFADHGYSAGVERSPYWQMESNLTFTHRFAGDLEPLPADCSPQNVINGVSRPISPDKYAWVSDPALPLPQDITLLFPEPVDISRVQLTFDTDLNNPICSAQIVPTVRQLVKDYDIIADGATIAQVRDSNARFRRHDITATAVKKLTVRVLATYGDASARIFEIRVY